MSGLNSRAEKLAEEATKLQAFNNLNLIGVKEQIAELLGMIGRAQGIFSTYTRHDISHIDTMLETLDWMIPPSTGAVMTPTDWLLIVLSIYLHDLGMFVPSAEYDCRLDNPAFRQFLERLEKDPDAKDYLARAESMSADEKERFFYQEFIRANHASRIREWVTGRLSRHWPEAVQLVAREIGRILNDLPTRFREHLALVCESHHKQDLHKTDIYPLYQPYGKLRKESANVQYAAFVLRTTDLVHVTKDRTPSMMYRLINFSDLKSVDEWDKQRGTFSVHMKSRSFDPGDTESHQIVVSADFTEERPFFALTEYLTWADSQIKQTKRWADKSQTLTDGKEFLFPWRGIQGDILVEGNSPRQMRFELDRGRLLDLLVGHTIYNDATVALRELLQNAIDAVRFQHYQEGKQSTKDTESELQLGRVIVKWDPSRRELIVEDNGTGMDLDIIQNHLLRVGSSFYDTPQFELENADFTPISRFGIGILTCFMISDNIEIITCRGGEGRRIRLTSVHAEYLLKDLQIGDPQLEGVEPNGTRVRLIVRQTVDLTKTSIIDILQRWIILPSCEVSYHELGKNAQRIGYENPGEALKNIFISNHPGYSDSTFPFEVVTKSPVAPDGGSYELAYLLGKGVMSELYFVTASGANDAAVCVEGIRVDWILPGFEQDFPCVLSVRNNRKFRTTVSRSTLERDEEYFKVSKICADALFEHVRKEIDRAAAQPGRPLLQASSVGRSCGRSLINRAAAKETVELLNNLYRELPLVVIEEIESSETPVKGKRSLISLNELRRLQLFWTIESRTVDYLATISRDIGRELSLSEFLNTLAPELQDSRLTPIIADAHLFSGVLLNSHSIESVEFSRKHQRTLLKWKQDSKHHFDEIRITDSIMREVATNLRDIGFQTNRMYDREVSSGEVSAEFRRLTGNVAIAVISGDMSEINRVVTRIAVVLNTGSEIAQLWETLDRALRTLVVENELSDVVPLITGIYVLSSAIQSQRTLARTRSTYNNYWTLLLHQLLDVMNKHGIASALPDNIDFILGTGRNVFDASNYWRDWDKI